MNIREKYIELFADIRAKKYLIIFAVAVFLIAFAVSVIAPSAFVKNMLMTMVKSLQSMAKELQHQPLPLVILNIFLHNALAMLVTLVLGSVFVLFPVLSLISNGYITGTIVIPNLAHINLLLPHGLFEFPAFFIGVAYAIWLGLWPYKENRGERLKERAVQCIGVYAYVVVPLLVVAAVLEGILFKYMTTQ